MADFSGGAESIDELIRTLEAADLFDDETQEALIDVAADNLIATIRTEGSQTGYNIQQLLQKVNKSRKVKKDRHGARYKVVSVSGKHTNGQRLATILFVYNYGRSAEYGEIPGSYFWTRAVQRCARTSVHKMEDAVTKILEQKGLI